VLTEDYIARIIQQAVAALGQAIGLRKSGQNLEALEVIQTALQGLFGIPSSLLYQLEYSSILDTMTREGKIDLDMVSVAADLFREAGLIYESLGKPASAEPSNIRALDLFLELAFMDIDSVSDELNQKIIDTQQSIGNRTGLETSSGLYYYNWYKQNHVQALEALGWMLEHTMIPDPETIEGIKEYLDTLLRKTDPELQAMGISRQEVETRVAALTLIIDNLDNQNANKQEADG
jgi:hypothetical protein